MVENKGESQVQDFLAFRKMITPIIIQIIFWVGVVLCVISGLLMIADGARAAYGGGGMVLAGLIVLLLGPVFFRIACESVILFFRMVETLEEIRKNTGRGAQ